MIPYHIVFHPNSINLYSPIIRDESVTTRNWQKGPQTSCNHIWKAVPEQQRPQTPRWGKILTRFTLISKMANDQNWLKLAMYDCAVKYLRLQVLGDVSWFTTGDGKMWFLTNTVLYALFILVAVCWNPFHHKFTRGVTYWNVSEIEHSNLQLFLVLS